MIHACLYTLYIHLCKCDMRFFIAKTVSYYHKILQIISMWNMWKVWLQFCTVKSVGKVLHQAHNVVHTFRMRKHVCILRMSAPTLMMASGSESARNPFTASSHLHWIMMDNRLVHLCVGCQMVWKVNRFNTNNTVSTKSLETAYHFPITFHYNAMLYQIKKTPMHFQTL